MQSKLVSQAKFLELYMWAGQWLLIGASLSVPHSGTGLQEACVMYVGLWPYTVNLN